MTVCTVEDEVSVPPYTRIYKALLVDEDELQYKIWHWWLHPWGKWIDKNSSVFRLNRGNDDRNIC